MTGPDDQDDPDFTQAADEVRIGPDGRIAQRFPGANDDKPWFIMDVRRYGLTATVVSDEDVAGWQRVLPPAAEPDKVGLVTTVDWDRVGRETTAAIDVLKSAVAAVKQAEPAERPKRVAICAVSRDRARVYAAEQGWSPHRWFYATASGTASGLRGWGGEVLCLPGCENRRDSVAVHDQIRVIRFKYGPRTS